MTEHDPKEIFVVSNIKRAFETKKGIRGIVSYDPDNPYELSNLTVHDEKTGKELTDAPFTDYARNFISVFSRTHLLNRKEFLDFQFEGSKDKANFLENIKTIITSVNLNENKKRQLTEWFEINKEKTIFVNHSNRPNRMDIAYCIYYLREAKSLHLLSDFPSHEAWTEISTAYGKSAKNIEAAFNNISNNRKERLRKTKYNNLEYVISNMLPPLSTAHKIALKEYENSESEK